jgi:hypothetical protein
VAEQELDLLQASRPVLRNVRPRSEISYSQRLHLAKYPVQTWPAMFNGVGHR